MKKKITLIIFVTLICLFSISIAIYLGTKQLKHFNFKTNLIEKLTNKDCNDFKSINLLIINKEDIKEKNFCPVTIKGTFLHNYEFFISPRTHYEQKGQHLITPIITDKGSIIFINRGWIPEQENIKILRPKGIISFDGLIKNTEKHNDIIKKNIPYKDKWSYINIDQMKNRLKIKGFKKYFSIEPFYIIAQPIAKNNYPVPIEIGSLIKNYHLLYSIIWFIIAFVLFLIYCAFIYRRIGTK